MPTTPSFVNAYEQLNPEQKKAVNRIHGPVMVLAGPGTGKTEVLAVRIGHILQQPDVHPSNILCLTFSNAGVQSMSRRLGELLGTTTAEKINIATFHSFALEIIEQQVHDNSTRKELITDSQRYMILEEILNNPQLSKSYFQSAPLTGKRIGSLGSLFNLLKKECITSDAITQFADKVINDTLPYESAFIKKDGNLNANGAKLKTQIKNFAEAVPQMYNTYQKILVDEGKFEFQDMLTEAVFILNNDENVLLNLQEQYQYILIDEFQDTNTIQLALVQLLIKNIESPNIFIVGDDDQTIYRFQGANQKNFDWITQMLPTLQTILLHTNYRSTPTILDHAFHLIKFNTSRHPLKSSPLTAGNSDLIARNYTQPMIYAYTNKEQEAFAVAQSIADLVKDVQPKETIGVLTRKNADLLPVAQWLQFFEVPFQYNKNKSDLLETTFGKAIYSTLMCLNNLDKDRGLASAHFSNLLLECGYTKELAYASLMYNKLKPYVPFIEWLQLKSADEKIVFVQEWLNKLLAFQTYKSVEIDDTVNKQLNQFIDNITNTNTPDNVLKAWEDFVAKFLKSDKSKNLDALADLLTYYNLMDLSIDFDSKQEETNAPVILSTIHGSKGLEYDIVFLLGCEAENWESKRKNNEAINVPKLLNQFINPDSDDEQDLRRILYVGMTRAKKLLYLSYNRLSNAEKPQLLSGLITPLIEKKLLDDVLVEPQDLPDIHQDRYTIQLDEYLTPLVKSKLDALHISASSINKWLDCQNKFFFQNICKIEGLPNVYSTFGSLVHKTLEHLSFKKNPHYQSTIKDVVDAVFPDYQYRFHPLHREKYSRYTQEVVASYLQQFPILTTPLHIEKCLTTTLPSGVKLKGYVDRIDNTSDGIVIIDYKTSRWPETLKSFLNPAEPGNGFWHQAMIYHYLVKDNFIQYANAQFAFHYVLLNKDKRVINNQNNDFEDWLVEILNQIHSLEYQKSCTDKDCNFCRGKLFH